MHPIGDLLTYSGQRELSSFNDCHARTGQLSWSQHCYVQPEIMGSSPKFSPIFLLVCQHVASSCVQPTEFSLPPSSFPRPISRTLPTQPFLLLVLSVSPPLILLIATFSLVLLDRSFDPVPSEHREVPGGGDDLLPIRVPGHVPDDPLVPRQLLHNLPGEQVVDYNPASGTASVDVPLKVIAKNKEDTQP